MAAGAGMRAGPAIADAALAAGIALLLALPIVGLTTVEGQYHLYIQPHLGEVGLIGLVVFVTRLSISGFRAYRARATSVNAVAPVRVVAAADQNLGKWLGWALLGGVVALPFAVPGYVSLGTEVLIYVMLGWGLNIVVGLAGLLDLGYVAFYGVGAYTVGLLSSDFGWSFWECLPVAGLAAGCFGILLGFPVLRLRGDYLAIVTLGFGEIIRLVLLNWAQVTGGPNGINDMPRPSFFGLPMKAYAGGHTTFDDFFHIAYMPGESGVFLYFVALALALATNLLALRLRRLPVGRAWEALREDEIACRAVGINPTSLKLSAFATGAMIGGLAGALFAAWVNFISPESFTFTESAMILASVVLGGRGSQLGVALAALLIVTFPEFARPLAGYRMVIFGAAMVAVMVIRPRGLVTSRKPALRLHPAAESRAG